MKLFWKMFCSMVLMTVLFCSFCGYFLIYRQFEDSMEKEVSGIFEENDLLFHMLLNEMKAHPLEDMKELSADMNLSVGQRKLIFRISDAKGVQIGGNGTLPISAAALVEALEEGEQGWRVLKQENGTFILHAAAAMMLGEDTVFLENYRDITSVYQERQEQFVDFYRMMAIFACMIGGLAFVIISMILKPLKLLSEATRTIAAGELDKRVEIKSKDELGQLSADFNSMADSLEAKIGELEAAARRQEEFIGSFAHEMKTPLTSIIGYADLLRSREMQPEKVRQNANYIFTEGQRLHNLSGKMMELIVLEREEFEKKPVQIKDFFERLKNEITPIMNRQGIDFSIAYEEAVIYMEEDLMLTVCLNLLDNARKAVEADGKIRLAGEWREDGYRIRIEDNGVGIPKEEIERIKEAFYMVDKSRARALGGAGLGLSICDKIVRLHGGQLLVESELGEGTRSVVLLKGGEAGWTD